MPDDCVFGCLACLDALSLASARASNKKVLRKVGDNVAKAVVDHLRHKLYANRFVGFPEVDDGQGQHVSLNEMMWRLSKDVDEVLIMGGMIGGAGGDPTNEVTKMIIEQDGTIRFETCAPMLLARSHHAAVYYKGEVLSISIGWFPSTSEATMERLDTLTQTQTQLADRLPNCLVYMTAAVLDDKLYVLGGKQKIDGNFVASDIMYALEEHESQADQGQWRRHEARLNRGRNGTTAIAFQGKIYACGGSSLENEYMRSVESFDPLIGEWRLEDEQMTTARAGATLVIFEDEIYAVAGDHLGQNTTIEKRNKATKRWEHVTTYVQDRKHRATVLVGSKVFLLGGERSKSTFDFFDLHSKKWASQDASSPYYDVSTRQLLREVFTSRAVLITPPVKTRKWTDLHQAATR